MGLIRPPHAVRPRWGPVQAHPHSMRPSSNESMRASGHARLQEIIVQNFNDKLALFQVLLVRPSTLITYLMNRTM